MTGASRSDTSEVLAAAVYDAVLRLLLPFAQMIREASAMPGWPSMSASERLGELAELFLEQIEILAEGREA